MTTEVSREKAAITSSRKALESVRQAWPLQKQEYAMGHEWKAEGKPIVWSCALFPEEIYYAMGIRPFFPEQFASLFSVRRPSPEEDTYAVRYCKIAEAEGFRDYLCGYARTALGYVVNGVKTGVWGDAPLGGPPLPDLIMTTSWACDVRNKWFEYMAHALKVPFFILDVPEICHDMVPTTCGLRQLVYPYRSGLKRGETDFLTGAPADYEVEYMVSQIEDAISFMAQVTGNKYDPDTLNEHLDWSYKTFEVNREINELRKAVPGPMPSTDGFASAYPRLYLKGTERCYNYFVSVRDELRERVAQGIGVIPEEKFRLAWYGLPTWFNMGIFNYFEKYGGVFVWEQAYNLVVPPPRRPEDPIKEIALKYLQGPGATQGSAGIGSALSAMVHDCREYKLSGVVQSYLITCRPIVFPAVEISNVLERELGVPTVALESDLVDERIFAESQAFTRLDAFGEELLRRGPVQY